MGIQGLSLEALSQGYQFVKVLKSSCLNPGPNIYDALGRSSQFRERRHMKSAFKGGYHKSLGIELNQLLLNLGIYKIKSSN